ncbi:MAG: O-acetylhomoserine aminocarboxypropyltransferase/cysteine synthase [Spirochaetaceae bacterium]|nr:O-acetylhomoserine aminocarboxypropyltransferase/cysteine synthase [Spirochaetaceae bacterium]MCF7948408.1 O-acetylhomoserine aminocarboxypropyltransferase/cysteine synthase [Spirochaetia bacterium]MCF7950857.1 O-acetylhomoserine aminocarboxypropyltransferase/cysteine synthase [Spirochaetaceae bacterium]
MSNNPYRFETQALHGGQVPDPTTGSRAVPVYRTSSYVFDSAEHAASLFALETPGNIYTRIGNPTQAVLEERLALLEGGGAAVAVASGSAAVFYSILNIAGQGDEIVSVSNLYGGTYTLFSTTLPGMGIKVNFVQPGDLDGLRKAINDKTKAVYTETIGNPGLDVADIPALSEIAHAEGLPLIVDATFSTPYLQRPIEQGADIVVHSLTKWIGGHGTVIGGAVVDGGKFDWTAAQGTSRFPVFTEPDPSYHGIRWAKDIGENAPVCFAVRLRTVLLRNTGAAISPDNAWQLLQGLETLPLRMERHCENAAAVARHLEKHPQVAWVRYPGLAKDPSNTTARRVLENGFGGMVVFGVKGKAAGSSSDNDAARLAGRRFIEQLKLFSHLANVGDAKSLAIHPGSTTHAQLSTEQQLAAGVKPELIRLSIGIEHIDDILADLDQALEAAGA